MDVLDHVTAHALRPDPLVLLSAVTGETRHRTMGIPERKFGRLMIERFDAVPFRLVVTLVATLSEIAFVRFNLLVAADASPGSVAELHCSCMTAPTRQ